VLHPIARMRACQLLEPGVDEQRLRLGIAADVSNFRARRGGAHRGDRDAGRRGAADDLDVLHAVRRDDADALPRRDPQAGVDQVGEAVDAAGQGGEAEGLRADEEGRLAGRPGRGRPNPVGEDDAAGNALAHRGWVGHRLATSSGAPRAPPNTETARHCAGPCRHAAAVARFRRRFDKRAAGLVVAAPAPSRQPSSEAKSPRGSRVDPRRRGTQGPGVRVCVCHGAGGTGRCQLAHPG
jgi:hypothetical protein